LPYFENHKPPKKLHRLWTSYYNCGCDYISFKNYVDKTEGMTPSVEVENIVTTAKTVGIQEWEAATPLLMECHSSRTKGLKDFPPNTIACPYSKKPIFS